MKTYSGNPSFSNQKNLEETEQQLDEVGVGVTGGEGAETHLEGHGCCLVPPQCSLKLDLLRAAHYKLSAVLSELEGAPRPRHPVRNISIRRWKDKVRLLGL